MKHLTIRNIGPINEADIELKRFNLLIGVQSSGKSTINKIACYCSWVEKEICITQSPSYFEKKGNFEHRLVVFHKLEGFIHPEAYIEYETDIVHFIYDKTNDEFVFKWKDRWAYIRSKTIYIPSERNIVASIPNWFDIKLGENNVRSYMSDWEEARGYSDGKRVRILDLGVEYAFEKTGQNDLVWLNDNSFINFTNASSGLQSLIPLLVILQYVTEGVFIEKKKDSVFIESVNKNLVNRIFASLMSKKNSFTIYSSENSYVKKIGNQEFAIGNKETANKFEQIAHNFIYPNYSNIFLEEPEQNLYPTTQKELINYLVELMNKDKKQHNVFITTHSPYILTSLNNLLYAAEVGKSKKSDVRKIIPIKYWVQFEDVGAWFVKNGTVVSIMDNKLKQIKAEKIDEVSNQLNRDYDKLFDLEYEAE